MQNLVLFVLVLLVIAAVLRIDFAFYLVYLFFGLYVLTRWWLERGLAGVRIEHQFETRAFIGDRVPVRLQVRNDSWLPVPWLRIHESLPIQLVSPNFYRAVVSLLPRQERVLEYVLLARRRGYYPLGPLHVSCGDPLGMRTLEREHTDGAALTVYPRILALEKLGLRAQSPFGDLATRDRLMEDPARIIGVRPYAQSDSMRHIHWKTSAITGSLQVKRFEPAISVEAMVLLNLNRGDYSLQRYATGSELAIEVAASIAAYLVDRRQAVGLGTNGRDPLRADSGVFHLAARKGRAHLMQILDVLGRIELQDQEPFEHLVRDVREHLGWGGTAVVITPDVNPEAVAALLLARRQGIRVLLVLTDPRGALRETQERMGQIGIPCHVVWREEDLDVWR